MYKTPHPATGLGIPRCELYIRTDSAEEMFTRALLAGGIVVSTMELRSWGDTAGYIADPDGHIIAFALAPKHSLKPVSVYFCVYNYLFII